MSTPKKPAFPHTSPRVSFPQLEEEVLEFWTRERTFERSIEERRRAGAKDYVFYDGPPFATGLPHYGHILTSLIKDTVPRFFTMRGHVVDRRWGWDCHGLPIENEIERELGISGKRQIEEYGVGKFNERCAEAVTRYTKEWEQIITRLGRWVDFRRDYKTMDLNYMESVLHVFWQLYNKGLIYEGDKVVAYCHRCQTPLSNFEARLDDSFRPRQDPSVTVRFRLLDANGAPDVRDGLPQYVLAWTPPPWTLPSKVALAVGRNVEYHRMRLAGDGDYWIAAERRAAYSRELAKAEVVESARGEALVGRRYIPLLPYFASLAEERRAFRVIEADFVSTEDGTGVVHIAPAFGEEDAEVGAREGLPGPNPVDAEGRFTADVPDFQGQLVFDANKNVIRRLKQDGSLVRQETVDHNYPHCWRDDTPLIYKAVPTWYLRVTAVKERMLAANQKINWVPDHIRDGRFGDWLSNARDWAISRNRYWGAPIPIWKCDKTGEIFVPRGVAELSERWGRPVKDLHRPAIDEITFPSPAGGTFRRIPEVLDCWFESGSMPYAQVHYPFENKEWFERNFPADFIVEYIAQTRGWFYTLVVLSAALFDRPPFSNCICHGVVLAEDGRKMSKRLKNYPDPMEIVHNFGSDSLRIALLSSPVVRGGNLRFSERYVEEAMRTYLIPLWNAYHFFTAYANIDGWQPPKNEKGAPADLKPRPANRTDRFILAKLEELKERLVKHMEEYDIVPAFERLREFIEQLNNWFIRLSRRRFWSDDDPENKRAAYEILYTVLRQFTLAAAPFIPFTAEAIYRGLCGEHESVHLQDWPAPEPQWKDAALVREVESIQRVIYLGRHLRERHNIKTRQPLATAQVAGLPRELVEAYRDEICGELNIKNLVYLDDPSAVVRMELRPDAKKLGPKLGKQFKDVLAAAKAGKAVVRPDGRAEVAGAVLEPEEFALEHRVDDKESACACEANVVVVLSLVMDRGLLLEGIARDLVRATQELRKQSGLAYADRIQLGVESKSPDVAEALAAHRPWIMAETLATECIEGRFASGGDGDGSGAATVELGDATADISLTRAKS